MKNALLLGVLATTLLASTPAIAKGGGRVAYGGGRHTVSHGGGYSGGQGSSHRGGSYRNSKTSNRYGTHK